MRQPLITPANALRIAELFEDMVRVEPKQTLTLMVHNVDIFNMGDDFVPEKLNNQGTYHLDIHSNINRDSMITFFGRKEEID